MDHDIENQYNFLFKKEEKDIFLPVKPEHRWVIRGDIENQGAGYKVVKIAKSPTHEDTSKSRFFTNNAWNKC